MHSASEAAQSTIISPHVRGVETETFLILSKISEEKEFLKTILEKYNVKNPGAIEKMIEQGKIDEHPAYEDYLSALSYEQNINDHRHLSTYPGHMHIGKEENVVEDSVTKIDNTTEENVKGVLEFVRSKLK
ncbi:MAG: hypothetical protein O8C62_01715 [Candidatus Methanoperedens sp.]|nr:hypothetical protein [Candidatus Methanoperedens sp.]